MANEYYSHGSYPAQGAAGQSAAMRAELDAVDNGFDKLPALSGNNALPVFVNSSGNGLEASSASTARTRLGLGDSATKNVGTAAGTVAAGDHTHAAIVAAETHAASSKTAPVDADELPISDSESTWGLKKLTWSNLKATLKTYFDTLYQAAGSYLTSSDIGSTVQAYDANTAKTNADQSWSGSQRATPVTDNDGSFDMNAANDFLCTPTGTITLVFTNYVQGQRGSIYINNTSNYTVGLTASRLLGPSTAATTLSATGKYWISYWCVDATSSAEVVLISVSPALS